MWIPKDRRLIEEVVKGDHMEYRGKEEYNHDVAGQIDRKGPYIEQGMLRMLNIHKTQFRAPEYVVNQKSGNFYFLWVRLPTTPGEGPVVSGTHAPGFRFRKENDNQNIEFGGKIITGLYHPYHVVVLTGLHFKDGKGAISVNGKFSDWVDIDFTIRTWGVLSSGHGENGYMLAAMEGDVNPDEFMNLLPIGEILKMPFVDTGFSPAKGKDKKGQYYNININNSKALIKWWAAPRLTSQIALRTNFIENQYRIEGADELRIYIDDYPEVFKPYLKENMRLGWSAQLEGGPELQGGWVEYE